MKKSKWEDSFKSLQAEDFIYQFNELMKEQRQNNISENRREDDEKVYFLETRKEFYPLQLVAAHRDGRDNCE